MAGFAVSEEWILEVRGVASRFCLDVFEDAVSSLSPNFFNLQWIVFFLHVELLPNITFLHKQLKEFLLLVDELILVVVNEEWSHDQIIKTFATTLARIALSSVVLDKDRLGDMPVL
jgi:hypothetical protein